MKLYLKDFSLLVFSLSVFSANAGNTVDNPPYTNVEIIGNDNVVHYDENSPNNNPGGKDPAYRGTINGKENKLTNVQAFTIEGDFNKLSNADLALFGQNNKASGIFGNVFGDVNDIDAGGVTSVYGNATKIRGDSANVVGSYADIEGNNASAIGNNTSVTADNSVSIGSGSANDRANTVSFGKDNSERQLIHLADGTQDMDGINLRQLRNANSSAISEAQKYTDQREKASNDRTDGLIAAEKQERVDGDAKTLSDSKSYTDQRETEINNRTDGLVSAEKQERIDGDAKTLSDSKGYTDQKETEINNRTDGLVSTEKQERIDGDAKTLSDSKGYTDQKETEINQRTDGLVSKEAQERMKADESIINSTRNYYSQREKTLSSQQDLMMKSEEKARILADEETLKKANQYTDQRLKNIDNWQARSDKRLNSGISGVMAAASIPYIGDDKFSWGIGIGNFRNANAVAAGIQFKISERTAIRLNVSRDSSSDTAAGLGFSGGW